MIQLDNFLNWHIFYVSKCSLMSTNNHKFSFRNIKTEPVCSQPAINILKCTVYYCLKISKTAARNAYTGVICKHFSVESHLVENVNFFS